MSEREYEYFTRKDQECSEYQRSLLSEPPKQDVAEPRHGPKRPNSGPVLMIMGALVGGTGALIKFGDEKCTITSSSIGCDEHSYNTANYVLIGLGATLFIIGIAHLSGPSNRAIQIAPYLTPYQDSGIAFTTRL